ncbi:MAG: alpha/beta hydrolase [Bacteroidota bacterium]
MKAFKKNPGTVYLRYIQFAFLLMGISFFHKANAQADSAFLYPPLGKLVDIGGWKLHLSGLGTDKKGPAVILESGIGDFSFDWSLVQPEVARFSPVYSYDRAGSAWSDMGPKPHTMHQDVYNLHALLKKANVPAPYILVGASHGALLVRLFAAEYPDEVAGLVLVDGGYDDNTMFINGKKIKPSIDAKGVAIPPVKTIASDTDNLLKPAAQKYLKDILVQRGFPHTQLDSPYLKLPAPIQQIRLWAIRQLNYFAVNDNDYYIEEEALLYHERKNYPYQLKEKPLLILTQGITNDTTRVNRNKELLLLSHNSKQLVDPKSGHHIQLEDPEFLVNAIKQVWVALEKHLPLEK